MERVAFLIEKTGERVSCLLNPENVVMRRTAGVAQHGLATGAITGATLSDDPLIATGGGVTEIDLDLLFDIDIARSLTSVQMQTSSPAASEFSSINDDVRELTRPIWNLAENAEGVGGYGAPPVTRLIWGKSWNIPGVVTAVSERLERFTIEGIPQRSWLRLRLRRVLDDAARLPIKKPVTPLFESPQPGDSIDSNSPPTLEIPVDDSGFPSLRFDEIAYQLRGDPAAWREIAAANGIDDPLSLGKGAVIRMGGPAAPERA
ncbi:hypothetical protein JQ582_33055 [Bradyrhizobium japonicum]|uniref:CIS tube protein n=1 Tax=Bradyrhizobium japonicum TaxID=375 RepID=UPI001BA5F6DB|nr:hypothetical protein [Bradyrhizobium japonicum]MBR0748771.1 hypothetical protein [Bradyrhizobium japonicum]